MLTADEINTLGDKAQQLISPVTDFLIEEIARRISEAGQLTSTAAYQVWRAQQLGISQKEIKKRLKKLLKVSSDEIERLLTQSAEAGYNFDIKNLPADSAIPFAENSSVQKIVSAAVRLAQDDLTNITQTMGFVCPNGKAVGLTDAYKQACDYAFSKASTGAQDYSSAVREATKNLAEKGIVTVNYESGVRTSLEAAVRRSVIGGLGLMQDQISKQNHDDFGCDGWEISAHAASAPDHEPIQGKQYSDADFEALNNSLVRRIGTLNCGHAAFPIIMSVSIPQYTDAELEQMRSDNEKGIDYEGRHFTMYQATQRQRQLEREIRKQKRRILVDESTGDKEKLQQDQIKYQVLNQEYKRFSKAAGLRLQHERMEMAGFGPKQVRAAEKAANAEHINWLKSIGAEDTELKTLAQFEDARYNNTDEYRLLTGYGRAVQNGDVSPLVGFGLYKSTGNDIDTAIVGQTTSTGVEIRSFATHFIDRVIGQASEAHAGMRQGVPIGDALDALKNPTELGEIRYLADGDIRQTFYGDKAAVTISIRDNRLIQANPQKGK